MVKFVGVDLTCNDPFVFLPTQYPITAGDWFPLDKLTSKHSFITISAITPKETWLVSKFSSYKESKKAYSWQNLQSWPCMHLTHMQCKEAKHKMRMKLHLHAKEQVAEFLLPTWICKATTHLSCFETQPLYLSTDTHSSLPGCRLYK